MKAETQSTLYKPLPIHLQMSKFNMATPTFYEYLTLVVVWPLALTIYLLLKYTWPSGAIPALLSPLVLFLFLGLVFLVNTPRHYLTAIGLTIELTAVTLFGLLQDIADLRKCLSPIPFHL